MSRSYDDVQVEPLGLTPLSAYRRKQIVWRIPGLIPAGMLSVLAGEQGTGKGLLIAAWSAMLTNAGMRVLLATAEDHPEYSLRPRMQAAGADMDRVTLVSSFDLPDDAALLFDAITTNEPAWLVIDPISEYMSDDYSSSSTHAVRRALAPLEQIVTTTNLAATWIMHLNKTDAAAPLKRIADSVAFTALARSVVLLGRHPDEDDPNARHLVHVKSNVSPLAASQRWRVEAIRLEETADEPRVNTARVIHDGASSYSAEALLARGETVEEKTEIERACDLIREQLTLGEMESRELDAAGEAQGISRRTMERARAKSGVVAKPPKRKGGPWFVTLGDCHNLESATADGGLLDGGLLASLNQAGSEPQTAKSPPNPSGGGLPPSDVSQSLDLGTAPLDRLRRHYGLDDHK